MESSCFQWDKFVCFFYSEKFVENTGILCSYFVPFTNFGKWGDFFSSYIEDENFPLEVYFSRIRKGYSGGLIVSQNVQNHSGPHLKSFNEALLFGNGHHADLLVIDLLVDCFLVFAQSFAELGFQLCALMKKNPKFAARSEAALDGGDAALPQVMENKHGASLLSSCQNHLDTAV